MRALRVNWLAVWAIAIAVAAVLVHREQMFSMYWWIGSIGAAVIVLIGTAHRHFTGNTAFAAILASGMAVYVGLEPSSIGFAVISGAAAGALACILVLALHRSRGVAKGNKKEHHTEV